MNECGIKLNGEKNKLLKLLRKTENEFYGYYQENALEELKAELRSIFVNWDAQWAKDELKEAMEIWANE